MKLSRRGMLRLLPTTPFLAKEAQRQTEEYLTGTSLLSPTDAPGRITGMYDPDDDYPGRKAEVQGSALSDFLKRLGLPDWRKRELRRDARSTRILDPDIAALKSVSLSARLHMQWKRNEAQLERDLYAGLEEKDQRETFRKKYKLGWF